MNDQQCHTFQHPQHYHQRKAALHLFSLSKIFHPKIPPNGTLASSQRSQAPHVLLLRKAVLCEVQHEKTFENARKNT